MNVEQTSVLELLYTGGGAQKKMERALSYVHIRPVFYVFVRHHVNVQIISI